MNSTGTTSTSTPDYISIGNGETVPYEEYIASLEEEKDESGKNSETKGTK